MNKLVTCFYCDGSGIKHKVEFQSGNFRYLSAHKCSTCGGTGKTEPCDEINPRETLAELLLEVSQ